MPTPARRQFARRMRRAWAEGRFLMRGLTALRGPGVGLLATWGLGTLLEHQYGAPPCTTLPCDPAPAWDVAAFNTWSLLFGEAQGALPAHALGQATFYLVPLLGILFVAEGVLKLGFTLFDKEQQREAWVSIHAQAARGHMILCGLGTVGFRVLEELTRVGEQVFVIERNPDGPFLQQARELGAEVAIGDARADNFLRSMNIEHARAVIVATDDDLANLEIAMDVRELRADVPIILRLYDQRLAQKVKGVLGVQVSVSTSKLAAPLFAAAALDTGVVGTHRVGDEVLVVIELDVAAGGAFAGKTVGDIERIHHVSVVALRPPGERWATGPGPDAPVEAYATVQLMVPGGRASEIRRLNGK